MCQPLMKEKPMAPAPGYLENNKEYQACQGNSLVNLSYQNKDFGLFAFENIFYIKKRIYHDPIPTKRKWKRSKIFTFSKSSRNRMFQLLAKVQRAFKVAPVHCTLTYHNKFNLKERSFATDFHAFLIALKRQFPGIYYIWRLERQKRGAPHYHIMLFLQDIKDDRVFEKLQVIARVIWCKIVDKNDKDLYQYGCKITKILNYRVACSYFSKYLAKEEAFFDEDMRGRRWGYSRDLPIDCQTEALLTKREVVRLSRVIRKWLFSKARSKFKWYRNVGITYNYKIYLNIELLNKLLGFIQGFTVPSDDDIFIIAENN